MDIFEKRYYDLEAGDIVTGRELLEVFHDIQNEGDELDLSFYDFLRNALDKDGTLEEVNEFKIKTDIHNIDQVAHVLRDYDITAKITFYSSDEMHIEFETTKFVYDRLCDMLDD